MMKRKGPEGPKFSVFSKETDKQIYLGDGVSEKEAQRLAGNLLQDAYIKEVKPAEE
jgi:hypothetical protein